MHPSSPAAGEKAVADDSVQDNIAHQIKASGANYDGLVDDAKAGTDAEHQLTLMEAVRKYPCSVGWSVLISMSIIMTGYDVVLLGYVFLSALSSSFLLFSLSPTRH
jgi:hypothetical protein